MHKIKLIIYAVAITALCACSISPNIYGSDGKNYKLIEVTPQLVTELRHKQYEEGALAKTNGPAFQYRIGAGDVLYAKIYNPSIQSFDGDTLSHHNLSDNWQEYNEVLVTDDGNATFPYAGDVQMKGKTLSEAKAALNMALSRYFKHPQSVLAVKEYYNSKVFVMGEVAKPAVQNIKAGEMSAMEAISLSQGANPITASFGNIYVIRGAVKGKPSNKEKEVSLNALGNKVPLPLRADNDGEYLLLDQIDGKKNKLAENPKNEIAENVDIKKLEPAAGGAGNFSTDKLHVKTSTYLSTFADNEVKPEPEVEALHTSIYQIDASSGAGIAIAAQFPLEPNDVVYISPMNITEWNRIITQIIPMNAAYLANGNNW